MKTKQPQWNQNLDTSTNIVNFLKFHNFTVQSYPIDNSDYNTYSAKGNGVILFFTDLMPEGHTWFHPEMDNKVFVDNSKCFDKMTRCPFSYNLPTNDSELEFLLEQFEWISSYDGLKHCQGTFSTEFIKYPRKLRKEKKYD